MRRLGTVVPLAAAVLVASSLHALANVRPYYWLPWDKGIERRVSQGNGDGTHGVGETDQYAWDFVGDNWLVRAARGGIVSAVRESSSVGGCDPVLYSGDENSVKIKHGDGTETLYAHLRYLSVPSTVWVGKRVLAYEPLGYTDTTGYACGAHLHYQVQNVCAGSFCQSVPSSFLDPDVVNDSRSQDGVPKDEQLVTSGNHVPWTDVLQYNPTTGLYDMEFADGSGGWNAGPFGTWDTTWDINPGFYNADPYSDVFLYRVNTGRWVIRWGNGSGGWSAVPDRNGTWSTGWDVNPGFYNLDGYSDLFLYRPTDGVWFIEKNDGTGGWSVLGQGTWSPNWKVYPGDYDADGDTDVFLYREADGRAMMRWSNGAGGWLIGPDYGNWSPLWLVSPGFYNADAYADLLLYRLSDGLWIVELANGSGGWSESGRGTWETPRLQHTGYYQGDRYTDVLLYEWEFPSGKIVIRVANGYGTGWSSIGAGDWLSQLDLAPGDYDVK